MQAKEKSEPPARLAMSRCEQRLKLVVGAGAVLPTPDRTIPEKRSAAHVPPERSVPGSARMFFGCLVLARLCRLWRCSKPAAIWGKPVVMQDVGVKAYIDRKNCGDLMISWHFPRRTPSRSSRSRC